LRERSDAASAMTRDPPRANEDDLDCFAVIARSVSDEAIQQACAKASSKRKTRDCFADARNDEEERAALRHCEKRSDAASAMTRGPPRANGDDLDCFAVIARSISDEAIQQQRLSASSKRRTLDCFVTTRNDEGPSLRERDDPDCFAVIARSISDEAIQQACAKASSKRRTLDCFAAACNDEKERAALRHCEERSDAAGW
jgi:hypothetical protein